MRTSVLIPARNEARSIYACVLSCLKQTLPPDEIIVVNDASEDNTLDVLKRFENAITVVSLDRSSGSKSYAQKEGLKYITGDILITTDADTILDKDFIRCIITEFENKDVMAAAGFVKSTKHNWLTACRELEYRIGQHIHKYAQGFMNTLFVIPGCAAAFRTKEFREYIGIDHDTLTEDLDFTYKYHKQNLKIAYSKNAYVYTQDPATVVDYIAQLRRWYGGSWQNLVKHYQILEKPKNALELSLIFCEGLTFPILLLLALFFNFNIFIFYYLSFLMISLLFALHGALYDKRYDLFLAAPLHIFISFINYAIFIEQFISEVLLSRNSSLWIQPKRRVAL